TGHSGSGQSALRCGGDGVLPGCHAGHRLSAAIFGGVLSISISTFLLSYVIAIPAAVRLRTRFPEVPRPFRVPTGDTGFRILRGPWLASGAPRTGGVRLTA